MNHSDINKIERIYACMQIPRWRARDVSAQGISAYGRDAAYILPKLMHLMFLVKSGDSYDGEFEEDMCDLERWFASREKDDWA